MKKRIVSAVLAVVLTMGLLTGCGNAGNAERAEAGNVGAEDTLDLTSWAEETLTEAKSMCVMEESADGGSDEAVVLPVLMEEETAEEAGTEAEEAGSENKEAADETAVPEPQEDAAAYDMEGLKAALEERLDPVKAALDEAWLEAAGLTGEAKDIVQAVAVSISEKSSVEVVSVDLKGNTVTYEVTSPDLSTYVKEMASGVKENGAGIEDLYRNIIGYLESEDIPVEKECITVPVEKDGNYWYLKMQNADLVEQVTGGLSGLFGFIQ